MKIGFLIYSLEKAGGSERVTVNLANSLQKHGHDVTVLTLYGNDSFFKLSDLVNYLSLSSTTGTLAKTKALIKLINTEGFDYLIGISIGRLNSYLGFLSFFLKKEIKLIASEHLSFNNSSALSRIYKRYVYKRFHKVVVLTQTDLNIFKGKGLKNVVSITNASSYYEDEALIEPIVNRSKVILAVGRLEFQKGFDLLIKSWASIYHLYSDWQLHIIGEGSLKEELTQMISNLFSNGEACKILPFTLNMVSHYNQAQLYVLSSRFEGLPMVMIEALCYGCPLISFDCETGPREIIEDGFNGSLVSPEDVEGLSAAMGKLIIDNDKRQLYFTNQLKCRKKYSIDEVIRQWNKILA